MDLYLSKPNDIFSSKLYNKRDFEKVNFQSTDGDVPPPLQMVYAFRSLFFLQEYVLTLVTSTTVDNVLNAKLLKQGYRFHKPIYVKRFLNSTTDTQNLSLTLSCMNVHAKLHPLSIII